jgi:hypothetical protein
VDDRIGLVYKRGKYSSFLIVYSNMEAVSQSMKVKSGYSEHLQELGLVTTHLIPLILNLLQLYGGVSKAVKLDAWSIDQFYVDRKVLGH